MVVEAVGGPDCPGLLVLPLKTSAISKDTVMKLSALFGVAIVLFSTVASAYDLTYLGPIKSRETKSVKVELPVGKLAIDVSSDDSDTKFNCQFSSAYGIMFEQNNVAKCSANVSVTSDTSMTVSVTNLSKDTHYKIWVHN